MPVVLYVRSSSRTEVTKSLQEINIFWLLFRGIDEAIHQPMGQIANIGLSASEQEMHQEFDNENVLVREKDMR